MCALSLEVQHKKRKVQCAREHKAQLSSAQEAQTGRRRWWWWYPIHFVRPCITVFHRYQRIQRSWRVQCSFPTAVCHPLHVQRIVVSRGHNGAEPSADERPAIEGHQNRGCRQLLMGGNITVPDQPRGPSAPSVASHNGKQPLGVVPSSVIGRVSAMVTSIVTTREPSRKKTVIDHGKPDGQTDWPTNFSKVR